MPRKYLIAILLPVVLGVTVFAVAFKNKYKIHITEAQIHAKLDNKFPLNKTALLLFDYTLKNPRFKISPQNKRLLMGIDLSLDINLNGVKRNFTGVFDASGELEYKPSKAAFYLKTIKVENIKIKGLNGKFKGRFEDLVTLGVTKFYKTHPIYTLNESNFKEMALRLTLKKVVVLNNEFIVTLGL